MIYLFLPESVLFLGLSHSLTADLQLAAAALSIVCAAVCVACSSCSSSCRCTLLLMFPSMLGSRGRAYLMLLLLMVLCRGPLSNIQSNVEAAALSLSCNLDLQIHHSKLLWRETLDPYISISQQLMDDKEEFQSEIRSVSRTFQEVRDEVVRQYGYNDFSRKHTAGTGSSTQGNRKHNAGTGSSTQGNRKHNAGTGSSTQGNRKHTGGTGSSTQGNRKHNAGTGSSTQGNRKHNAGTGSSTQEQFSSRTMMQCDSVVGGGVQRCSDWFSLRWAECMEAVSVPVINHLLCICMKLHFLCDVLRVMTPWCRDQVPVEGNFGQLFDRLNESMDLLSREFSAELVLQEVQQQEVLGGALMEDEFTEAVRGSFRQLRRDVERLLTILQLMLSFTFISTFTQAFGYLRQYRRDVRFDNLYITSRFRRMDARRSRAGKRCVLPLLRPQQLIEPCSLRVHQQELQHLSSGVCQLLSLSLLSLVLLTVDFSLFHVMNIVSTHTISNFNLTSRHQVDIRVGGASMMARLLRKTVSAFNRSSSVSIHTHNRVCVFPPSPLPAGVYVSCVICVLMVALCSVLQVYTHRLRRAISAYYYPQTEKRRVLFLYNLQLQRRISSPDSERLTSWAERSRRVCQSLCRCGRSLQQEDAPPA
ncbi:E3 ubiquitin-protein ligase DCST1 [Eleginops maclovinus]|uniref:E3 ubiquitin-protein ligase DCST1 n=1 Tax=Eleginops maclovinus TaxID=56733 RepID=UPI00307FD95C